MSETMRQLKLRLENDRLYVSRLGKKDGHFGKRERWKIQKKSYLPKGVYFLIHNFIRQQVKSRDGDDFFDVKKKVLRGLSEAAIACGCETQSEQEGADVCWYLKGEPFFAAQIHEDELDMPRLKRMRSGNAMFRWG